MLKYLEITKAGKYQYTWVLKTVFGIGLLLLLYYQLSVKIAVALSFNQFIDSLKIESIELISLVLLLMMINWGIEALKWKILLEETEPQSFLRSFKSVLSGVSSSMFLPNRAGDFFGRMIYLKKEVRLKSVSLSAYGSIAQWIATLVCGALSLLLSFTLSYPTAIGSFFMQFLFYVVIAGSLFSLLIYYKINRMALLIRNITFLQGIISKFGFGKISVSVSNQVLILSFFRYFVFVIQYYLLMRAFNIDIPVAKAFILISLILLIITLIPTITLSEIGVRGNVALFFLIPYTNNEWGIVFFALMIWVINLVIPALIGGVFIIQHKPSNKIYEEALA
jgi:uncharacterized membrane protein YbhN (UPF0104 family)